MDTLIQSPANVWDRIPARLTIQSRAKESLPITVLTTFQYVLSVTVGTSSSFAKSAIGESWVSTQHSQSAIKPYHITDVYFWISESIGDLVINTAIANRRDLNNF